MGILLDHVEDLQYAVVGTGRAGMEKIAADKNRDDRQQVFVISFPIHRILSCRFGKTTKRESQDIISGSCMNKERILNQPSCQLIKDAVTFSKHRPYGKVP